MVVYLHDFMLGKKEKKMLHRQGDVRPCDIDDFKANVTSEIKRILEDDLKNCFQHLHS